MKFAPFFALVPLCFAGTRPRPNPADYRAQETSGDITVAAEIIPSNQVRNLFSTDLSKYIVVEVAVYPKDGTTIDLHRMDFALKLGSGETIRAANPEAIARTRQQAAAGPPRKASDIDVYTTVGVGYESGPYHRGVYTETGVAVTNAPPSVPRPASTDPDRRTMQLELEDNGLPEGTTSKAVAGYLYFPAPTSKKNATRDLEYYAPQGRVRLTLK